MYQNKQFYTGIVLITIIIGFSLFSACSSSPEASDEKAKKEKKKKEDKKHKMALIPFSYSFNVGSARAQKALNTFAEVLQDSEKFKPSSMKEWMGINFKGNRASSIKSIISLVENTGLELNSFSHGWLFRSGKKYGVVISVYSKNGPPSYYYRSFLNYMTLKSVFESIVNEMEARTLSRKRTYFSRNLYIQNSKIKFYTYTQLKSGEESIIELPYLNIGGVSYKSNDQFFQQILLYTIHSMQLFKVWNSNIPGYTVKYSTTPSGMDYDVSFDIDISKTTSLFTAHVRKLNGGSKTFQFQFPFDNLEMDELYKTMRLFALNIVIRLLNDNEQRNIGILNINNVDNNESVFCDNYYIGHGIQNGLIFPVGAVKIMVDSIGYKSFVSPYGVNDRLYNLDRAFLLKLKKRKR